MGLAGLALSAASKPLFLRTAVGAAAGFFAGRTAGRASVGDERTEYRPLFTVGGALLGAAAGFTYPAWGRIAKPMARGIGKKVVGHFEKMPGQYAAARAALAGAEMGEGMKMYTALTQSYMSMPLMLGGGALLGMSYADHHGMSKWQGALLGAGLGGLAKGGTGLYDWWTKDMNWTGAKTIFAAGTSAAIMTHGVMNRDLSTVYGAEAEPYTGQTMYGGPIREYEEPATVGIKERIAAIGASGDVVLGSHNRRHR